jgi:hypothetical protein
MEIPKMKATNKNRNKSFNPLAKNGALLLNRNTRIAEYAYYKSKSRVFESGHEVEDWLEAERHFEQQTVLFQSGDYYLLSI